MTTSIEWGTVLHDYVIRINKSVYIGQDWFLDCTDNIAVHVRATVRVVHRVNTGGTVREITVRKVKDVNL